MGWASGSELAFDVWEAVKEYIPADAKRDVARKIIDAFQDKDCDTMEEAGDLWAAAEMPGYCYDCDEEFPYGMLDGDNLCEDCAAKADE